MTVHDEMRRWAKGMYALEAGVELLIRTNMVDRMEAHGCIHTSVTHPGKVYPGYAWPDVTTFMGAGGLSGGERRLLVVAANLLGEWEDDEGKLLLDLADLAGLDRGNCRLVLAAIAHAMGTHEMADVQVVGDRIVDNGIMPPLVDWPGDDRG